MAHWTFKLHSFYILFLQACMTQNLQQTAVFILRSLRPIAVSPELRLRFCEPSEISPRFCWSVLFHLSFTLAVCTAHAGRTKHTDERIQSQTNEENWRIAKEFWWACSHLLSLELLIKSRKPSVGLIRGDCQHLPAQTYGYFREEHFSVIAFQLGLYFVAEKIGAPRNLLPLQRGFHFPLNKKAARATSFRM